MDVDGRGNTVHEMNTESPPPGPENPLGNAFRTVVAPLRTESEGLRVVDPLKARYWKVLSSHARLTGRTASWDLQGEMRRTT
ncbi:MAG: hypothetical protein M3R38_00260 [Actinomycetota bacterium]|nr:hypothetical protein [Actinomycetota bacterium]